MKIEKLTNNTYRVRQQYKGKRYTVYFDHKPTQKEVLQRMAEELSSVQKPPEDTDTVEQYIDRYIALKEKQKKPPISPATIRGYESIKRNLSEEFLQSEFMMIDSTDVKREVNRYKVDRSAKTVKNMYGLISSLFNEFRPEYRLVVKLPTGQKKAEYEPTTKDIQRVLEYTKDSPYGIAIQLAVLGLRRGEICALKMSDLSADNVLRINKDIVADKNNKLVVKNPKTEASYREITLPAPLAEEIRNRDYIYDGYPGSIARYLHRAQDKLGIPRFKLHKMRAFCAAYLHKQGYTDEQIMSWGGWATPSIMQQAYRYNLDPEESQAKISDSMSDLF